MKEKLVLNIEKAVIERAKSYAKKTGRSLSDIIENYLEALTQDSDDERMSPKLRKIVGAVRLPNDFDEEKEKRSYLEKKTALIKV